MIWGRSAVLREALESLTQCQNKLSQRVFTQFNAQVQRWRGKGLLMFPGLFILPSVWLRTPTHPSLRTSFSGSHLEWHGKVCDMIGEEQNVACVRGREEKKRNCIFNQHDFQGMLSTHSSIYCKGNKSAKSPAHLCAGVDEWAVLSISNSSCNFLYKHRLKFNDEESEVKTVETRESVLHIYDKKKMSHILSRCSIHIHSHTHTHTISLFCRMSFHHFIRFLLGLTFWADAHFIYNKIALGRQMQLCQTAKL